MPSAGIGVDVIVGFPEETNDDFLEFFIQKTEITMHFGRQKNSWSISNVKSLLILTIPDNTILLITTSNVS